MAGIGFSGFHSTRITNSENYSMYKSRCLAARKLVGITVTREARDGFIVLNARIALG